MTKLLEKAFEEVSKLPENEQNSWASIWLEELADEKSWDEKLTGSLDVLDQLAAEALGEHQVGKTRSLEELLEIDNEQVASGRCFATYPKQRESKPLKVTSCG